MDKYNFAMGILKDMNELLGKVEKNKTTSSEILKTINKAITIKELPLYNKIDNMHIYHNEENIISNCDTKKEKNIECKLEIEDSNNKKRVITLNDIKSIKNNISEIIITKHTIVTSLALEEAKNNNIKIIIK